MTYKQLNKFIRDLNLNKANEYVFLRPLTTTVDFAIVWDYTINPLTKIKSLFMPLPFYFIKNAENIYVAAVSDMCSDLHWLVLPKFRGNGYLTNALKETILPYLFQEKRGEQRITIDLNAIGIKNYNASLKVAKSLGFIESKNVNGKTEMTLSESVFSGVGFIKGQNSEIQEGRVKILKDRAREISKELLKIQSELEMKLGIKEDLNEIKEIAKMVEGIPNLIQDALSSRD